jgi:hypothetical protein
MVSIGVIKNVRMISTTVIKRYYKKISAKTTASIAMGERNHLTEKRYAVSQKEIASKL